MRHIKPKATLYLFLRISPRSSGSTPHNLRGKVVEAQPRLPSRQVGSHRGRRCVSAVVPPAARSRLGWQIETKPLNASMLTPIL